MPVSPGPGNRPWDCSPEAPPPPPRTGSQGEDQAVDPGWKESPALAAVESVLSAEQVLR